MLVNDNGKVRETVSFHDGVPKGYTQSNSVDQQFSTNQILSLR